MCLHTHCKYFEETAQITILSESYYISWKSQVKWQKAKFRPCTAFTRLGRGYKWLVRIIYFAFMHESFVTTAPPPPVQGNVEEFDFSNHHSVGTASWRNHDNSPPSLLLYCTAMFVYQTPTFPPHYRDNVIVKLQHITAYAKLSRPDHRLEWRSGYKWLVHYL